jgi:hypothetical protein
VIGGSGRCAVIGGSGRCAVIGAYYNAAFACHTHFSGNITRLF